MAKTDVQLQTSLDIYVKNSIHFFQDNPIFLGSDETWKRTINSDKSMN